MKIILKDSNDISKLNLRDKKDYLLTYTAEYFKDALVELIQERQHQQFNDYQRLGLFGRLFFKYQDLNHCIEKVKDQSTFKQHTKFLNMFLSLINKLQLLENLYCEIELTYEEHSFLFDTEEYCETEFKKALYREFFCLDYKK